MASEENALRSRGLKSNLEENSDATNKSNESEKPNSSNKPKILNTVGIAIGCLVFVIGIIIVLLPSPIHPEAFQLEKPPAWIGNLEPNSRLQDAELLYRNQIRGPESLAYNEKNGALYSGTSDGKIVKLIGDSVSVVTMLGKPPCDGSFDSEPRCGRPLGMRFDKRGRFLFVADAYLGLYKVNVSSGQAQLLVAGGRQVDGHPLTYLNDLDIDDNDRIYFTDTSYRFSRRVHRWPLIEAGPCGRLLSHDMKTGETKVLLDGLYSPNGVQLGPKQDFLLFSSSSRFQVLKYHMKGSKTGQVEVFSDNFPGLPDNIRRSPEGGYWVGTGSIRKPDSFSFYDFLAPRPWIKTLIFKIFSRDFIRTMKVHPKYAMIVKLNEEGEIVRSLHNPAENMPEMPLIAASEVLEVNNTLYLGCYWNPFVAKLVLK